MELARWFRDHAPRLMGGDGELSAEAKETLLYKVRRGESPVPVSHVKTLYASGSPSRGRKGWTRPWLRG